MELTKSAEKLVCFMYNDYLFKVKNGSSLRNARKFDSRFIIGAQTILRIHPDDMSDLMLELGQKKYIQLYIGGSFELNNSTIIYMENRFKKGIKEVTDFISKFIP